MAVDSDFGAPAPRRAHLDADALSWSVFLLATGAVTLAVLLTGGAPNTLVHLYYLPILYVAVVHGVGGAFVAGGIAGLVAGPWMPGSAGGVERQAIGDWSVRLLLFIVVGVSAALLARMQPRPLDVLLRDALVGRSLRSALRHGRIRVHYQPLVDLTHGEVVGFEALCRWTDNSGNAVPPAMFIPSAERTGVIRAVGRSVLTQAVAQARLWAEQGHEGLIVNVNVSAVQLSDASFLLDMRRILDSDGAMPFTLCLEITETAIIADPKRALATLNEARSMGVVIALDDFGTGQSSLEYLAGFPIDVIKIDRSFIDPLGDDPKTHALVRAIVHMAHSLGAITIAEGVETSDQMRTLGSLGCAIGQGYHLGRPSTADGVEWLSRDVVAG